MARAPALPERLALLALAALGFAACAAAAPPTPTQPALAIANVTLIDVEHGRVRGPVTVWLRDGRIERIAPDAPAPGARTLDGTGRWLVPGLIDLHVHLFNNASKRPANTWTFPLFVADGVTGVREMFTTPDELAEVAQWRAAVDAGTLIAPHVLAAGTFPYATSDDEARAIVHTAAARGADFVKVFSEVTPQRWHAILDAARAEKLPVDGHVPAAVTLAEATRAKQRTAEHLMQVYEACSAHGPVLLAARQGLDGDAAVALRDAQETEVLATFDADTCTRVARAVAKAGPVQVPTVVIDYFDVARPHGDPASDPHWAMLRTDEQTRWRRALDAPHDAAERTLAERRWDVTCRIVRTFAAVGAPLLAGTDSPMPLIYPGYALHDELEQLVACGLTPAQALRGATFAAAELLAHHDSGRIAPGARADLVLLDADPLADIHALRRIHAVVLAGRVLDRAALDALVAPP
jgi:imidazolonepropionase-like amidohydrolase